MSAMDLFFKLTFSRLSNFMYSNRYAKFHQNLRGSPGDPLLTWHGPYKKFVNLAWNDPMIIFLYELSHILVWYALY